jgi:ATP-dependent helicase Lhr and Lhr-like helicase
MSAPPSGRLKVAIDAWFKELGWKPFAFQKEVWAAVRSGKSGLLHATTGAGKTYAVWLAALQALTPGKVKSGPVSKTKTNAKTNTKVITAVPLTVLWLTPMRALAADTARALQTSVDALNALDQGCCPWTVGARTGDTTASERAAQTRRLPSVLITTPESLSLMLSKADARETLASVRLVVVDEWHELMGNKRGVQVQLALARLRQWQQTPTSAALRIWGMSATLGNLDQAMHTLLGQLCGERAEPVGVLVQGAVPKKLVIDTLLPEQAQRFAWAGHLGLTMLPQVVHEVETSATTLLFTNTRSQAELWFRALLEARPDWAGIIALHHGSLDSSVREWVEAALKSGQLKAVVCTSSLDLGVDFLPVERVLQIGSSKGVARLLQRAGRSGHAPGRPSRITLVPTHSLEIIEAAAARAAVQAGQIEGRAPPQAPLDVLVQHLVTVALGGGFTADALYAEVRSTQAYAQLTPEAWQWCLDFVRQGGPSLAIYPDYRRAAPGDDGVWRVDNAQLARRHLQNIGTISSSTSMVVQFFSSGGSAGGAKLGTIEEGFIARLKTGDCFLFAGRTLELVRVYQMTAFVKRATGKKPAVPRWAGGRMPLSSTLAAAMVLQLEHAAFAMAAGSNLSELSPEMARAYPLLEVQQRWSALPTQRDLVAEVLHTREGWHLFIYPFAGRNVHTGLANLMAWRAARVQAGTFSMAVNDYGIELLSASEIDWQNLLIVMLGHTGSQQDLLAEVLASLNASELARRRFRDIARVSGLVYEGHPGERKSARQLQASSQLFYDVFRKYDPSNQLLLQAEQELLQDELDIQRLQDSLHRMQQQSLCVKHLERPTPFSFPLMVERLREQLSNESMAERIARMLQQLELAADGDSLPVDSAVVKASVSTVAQAIAFSKETSTGLSKAARKRRLVRR